MIRDERHRWGDQVPKSERPKEGCQVVLPRDWCFSFFFPSLWDPHTSLKSAPSSADENSEIKKRRLKEKTTKIKKNKIKNHQRPPTLQFTLNDRNSVAKTKIDSGGVY